jgi:NAD kinase
MFKGPVPPVVSFSMGSLGFMTPFRILHLQPLLLFFGFALDSCRQYLNIYNHFDNHILSHILPVLLCLHKISGFP